MRWAMMAVTAVLGVATVQAQSTGGAESDGHKLETAACASCHSLRLVESQRLSPAAWGKEVDKMVGWGAVVPEKQKLIDYLASEYPDSKPVPAPDRSVDKK
jgi:mono/diheme cytochrome c family protein